MISAETGHRFRSKLDSRLVVPLNAEAVLVLRRQAGQHPRWVFAYQGHRVTRANNHAWRKALVRADISDFRWHDLRHTWASWHVQRGTPLNVLQELGGWESVEMVRRYAHLDANHLAEYADRLSSPRAVEASHDTKTTLAAGVGSRKEA